LEISGELDYSEVVNGGGGWKGWCGEVECGESVLCNAHFGRHRSFALKLRLISVKGLLSAILQVIAGMVFWKTMLEWHQ